MAAKGTKAKGGKEYGSKRRKAEGKALRKAAKNAAVRNFYATAAEAARGVGEPPEGY